MDGLDSLTILSCRWEPQRYLDALVEFLSTTPPFAFYWKRSTLEPKAQTSGDSQCLCGPTLGAGTAALTTSSSPRRRGRLLHPSPLATCDLHAPLHTSLTRHAQDFGTCYLSPRVAHRAIVVSHFGFRGGLADFMSLKRWRGVSHGALNASASLSVHDPKIQRRLNRSVTDNSRPPPPRAAEPEFELWNGGGAAQRNYSVARDLRRTAYIPWRAHLSYLASTWLWARDRWVGTCFDPQKDVVTPVRAGRWASLEPT